MKKAVYEVSMAFLAIIAVVLVIMDLEQGLNSFARNVDISLLIIFTVDYFVRLYLASDKRKFFKSNVFDLISILPFNAVFRAFRIFRVVKIAKLARVTKLLKLSRLFAYTARLSNRAKTFLNTNGFKYVLLMAIALIGIGGISIHFIEGMSFLDGIWWAFVTTTTVGYGDLSPKTGIGRVVAMILMIAGIGLIGSLTSTITSYFIRAERKKSFSSELIDNIKIRLDDVENISDSEIDEICVVLKSLKTLK